MKQIFLFVIQEENKAFQEQIEVKRCLSYEGLKCLIVV